MDLEKLTKDSLVRPLISKTSNSVVMVIELQDDMGSNGLVELGPQAKLLIFPLTEGVPSHDPFIEIGCKWAVSVMDGRWFVYKEEATARTQYEVCLRLITDVLSHHE